MIKMALKHHPCGLIFFNGLWISNVYYKYSWEFFLWNSNASFVFFNAPLFYMILMLPEFTFTTVITQPQNKTKEAENQATTVFAGCK